MRYWSYDQLIMERLAFAAGLLPGSHQRQYQNAFTLLALAWCQQVCCKLSAGLMQVDFQDVLLTTLIKVVINNLQQVCKYQVISYIKADFHRLDATWWKTCIKLVKSTTCTLRLWRFWLSDCVQYMFVCKKQSLTLCCSWKIPARTKLRNPTPQIHKQVWGNY